MTWPRPRRVPFCRRGDDDAGVRPGRAQRLFREIVVWVLARQWAQRPGSPGRRSPDRHDPDPGRMPAPGRAAAAAGAVPTMVDISPARQTGGDPAPIAAGLVRAVLPGAP